MGLKIENPIAWNINLLTIDGYDGEVKLYEMPL